MCITLFKNTWHCLIQLFLEADVFKISNMATTQGEISLGMKKKKKE